MFKSLLSYNKTTLLKACATEINGFNIRLTQLLQTVRRRKAVVENMTTQTSALYNRNSGLKYPFIKLKEKIFNLMYFLNI